MSAFCNLCSKVSSPDPPIIVVFRSNGETKKLSVAVLQLSAEVVHYIVPSKEPAAYLQTKVGPFRALPSTLDIVDVRRFRWCSGVQHGFETIAFLEWR